MNIETKYMGLTLRSPLLVTDAVPDVDLLAPIVDAGVGAIVLQPLLEEEIILDIKLHSREVAPTTNYGNNLQIVNELTQGDCIQRYLECIRQLKQRFDIPVIASVDCYSFDAWFSHIRFFEEAGCDAVEFNVQLIPANNSTSYEDVDRLFNDLTSTYRRSTEMPLSVKITPYHSDLANFVQRLSWQGVQNVTLFNSPIPFDIDLASVAPKTSIPSVATNTLFWAAMLKRQISCNLSTVVDNGDELLKALLCGATTAHISHQGSRVDSSVFQLAIEQLHTWMQQHGHACIEDFQGSMSPIEAKHGTLDLRSYYIQQMKKANLR